MIPPHFDRFYTNKAAENSRTGPPPSSLAASGRHWVSLFLARQRHEVFGAARFFSFGMITDHVEDDHMMDSTIMMINIMMIMVDVESYWLIIIIIMVESILFVDYDSYYDDDFKHYVMNHQIL